MAARRYGISYSVFNSSSTQEIPSYKQPCNILHMTWKQQAYKENPCKTPHFT